MGCERSTYDLDWALGVGVERMETRNEVRCRWAVRMDVNARLFSLTRRSVHAATLNDDIKPDRKRG